MNWLKRLLARPRPIFNAFADIGEWFVSRKSSGNVCKVFLHKPWPNPPPPDPKKAA